MAAEPVDLAAPPLERAAPADARAVERLAAVEREREEDADLARLPELAFEREAGAAFRVPAADLLRLVLAVGLLALAADPDLLRREPEADFRRGVAPEPELLPAALELVGDLRVDAFAPFAFGEEPVEPEADDPEADEPLLEPDDVRFLAVLRRFAPLSFSTAMSSSHRDRGSGSAQMPTVDTWAGKACYRATPPLLALHADANALIDEVTSDGIAAGQVDPGHTALEMLGAMFRAGVICYRPLTG